jgi:putative membrane protein
MKMIRSGASRRAYAKLRSCFMIRVSEFVLLFCALEHVGFFILESFLWKGAFVKKRFRMSDQKAADTADLAKNQGVYNLFLAAGLILSFANRSMDLYAANIYFFLGCIVVAGLVGAATVTRRIFVIQALPALIAIVLFAAGY